jgi:hypothetical protein
MASAWLGLCVGTANACVDAGKTTAAVSTLAACTLDDTTAADDIGDGAGNVAATSTPPAKGSKRRTSRAVACTRTNKISCCSKLNIHYPR